MIAEANNVGNVMTNIRILFPLDVDHGIRVRHGELQDSEIAPV